MIHSKMETLICI